jgi:hypothetical protein
VQVNKWVKDAELRIIVRDVNGKCIFMSDVPLDEQMAKESNKIEALATIPEHFLRPGSFAFTFATLVHNHYHIDFLEDVVVIDIVDGGSKYAATEGNDYGYIFFDPNWKLEPLTRTETVG